MDTTTYRRAQDRSRGMRRLRDMTIGTAMLGAVATGAFGAVAALTYDGSAGTTTAAIDQAATTTTTTTTDTSGSTSVSGSTSTTPTVTTTTGTTHAKTGGSK